MAETKFEDDTFLLPCGLWPERQGPGHCGVFFDIFNHYGVQVLITGLVAGSCGDDEKAKLFARTAGRCDGYEHSPAEWREVWSGTLEKHKSTNINFSEGIAIAPGAEVGFLLHSGYPGVQYSEYDYSPYDHHIRVFPWWTTHNKAFGNHQSRKACPAGAVKYKVVAKPIIVNASRGKDRVFDIVCSDMGGMEIAVFNDVEGKEPLADIQDRLASMLNEPAGNFRLILPNGIAPATRKEYLIPVGTLLQLSVDSKVDLRRYVH